MKFTWGSKSLQQLSTIDPDMVVVFNHALATGIIDLYVNEGRRNKEKQTEYFRENSSKVEWPDSKHNVLNPGDLAKAADVVPYVNGVSWNPYHCCVAAGIILTKAKELDIPLRWGGNWDMDAEPITDQDFQDLVHWERVKEW